MFLRAFRRSPLRRYSRAAILLLGLVALLDLLSLLSKYKVFQRNLVSATVESRSELPSSLRDQKILICAQFWTSAAVLAGHWNDDLIELIETLRVQNVYVSIYESGSLDQTKDVLRQLDEKLEAMGVQKRVILDPTTHQDEISNPHAADAPGWIRTPRSGEDKELRRIPYLAGLRNKVLQPLYDGSTSMEFDKVLFLNDVDFRPSDVLTLLATRGGDYSVACALDFMLAPRYYDTFVLRDSRGRDTATETFPYFRSSVSRQTMMEGQATLVQSCWNGMLLMDASPFRPRPDGVEALKFRGIPDTLAEKHVEGSECCLIHADLAARGEASAGIWVNPAVRVGYSSRAYEAIHDESGVGWMTPREYVTGVYRTRLAGWLKSDYLVKRKITKRHEAWVAEGQELMEGREEPGALCLSDEMQILIWNGWKHL